MRPISSAPNTKPPAILVPDPAADNDANVIELTENLVNRAGRTGGTFLHTSRTRPSRLPMGALPPHLADRYDQDFNDVTPDIIRGLEYLGVDYLIPIGGDDTLSYSRSLHDAGMDIIAGCTILGEGVRGSLTKQLIDRFDMHGENPQTYETGIKEIWKVKPENHRLGRVLHTMGWPHDPTTFGGGWLYDLKDDPGRGKGHFALQMHSGNVMHLMFKDIEMRRGRQ